jgi:Predicted glycosyltransferases
MNSELIICSKNRPRDLETCLISIQKQDVIPSRILIIDASSNGETLELSEKFSPILPLLYLKSNLGLARQRNLAVKHLSPDTEVVHFIDDDVILDPHYFAAIERIFNNDSDGVIGGAGGFITNNLEVKPTIAGKIFLLESSRKGVILSSFKNTMVFTAQNDVSVDWLGGCSMSYRREVVQEFQFDSNLQGYSLGEDVDFSYRVSRKYKIIMTPSAKLIHTKSPTERQSGKDWNRSEAVHRYYYVKKNLKKRKYLFAFWWSIAGWIMINSVQSIMKLSRWYSKNTLGSLLGVFDIITKNHYLLNKQVQK